jgi:hypothetical protein
LPGTRPCIGGQAVVGLLGDMSDRALDILAEAHAVGEHLGQHEHGQLGEQGNGQQSSEELAPRGELTRLPRAGEPGQVKLAA